VLFFPVVDCIVVISVFDFRFNSWAGGHTDRDTISEHAGCEDVTSQLIKSGQVNTIKKAADELNLPIYLKYTSQSEGHPDWM
jgi:hypothetical protein